MLREKGAEFFPLRGIGEQNLSEMVVVCHTGDSLPKSVSVCRFSIAQSREKQNAGGRVPGAAEPVRFRVLSVHSVRKLKGLNLADHVHDAAVARLNDTDHALSELYALRLSGHGIGDVAELFDAL